jgi:hypothetical protein
MRLNQSLYRPEVHRLACELGPVVDGDRFRRASQDDDLVQRGGHLLAAEGAVRKQSQTLAGELIDDGQHADPASVRQPLRNEIYAPLLGWDALPDPTARV